MITNRKSMRCLIQKSVWLLLPLLLAGFATGCSVRAKKERHLARADRYFQAGQYPAAEIEYLNVLRLDNQNALALTRLGTIYYADGRLVKAYPFLKKALELNSNDLKLRQTAALEYLAVGDITNAQAQAQTILDQSPTNDEAPLVLAECARSQKSADTVRQNLEKLRRKIGDTASLELGLGTLDLRARDWKAAEAAFRRALALDPKSSPAHAGLGTLYWAQNDLTNADLELKRAADLSPPRSNRRLNYAQFKLKTGHIEEGTRVLTELTKSVPDYLPAWLNLAEVALAQQQYTNCASLVREAQLRDPDNISVLLLDARLKLAQKEPDKAIAVLNRLSTLYPHSPQTFYQLALAYLLKGDTTKALNNASQAVSLDPKFDKAILLEAQLQLRKNSVNAAINVLTKLIQRQPRMTQAYLLLVNAYAARSDYDNALATCRRLQELYPRNPEVPLLAGRLYLQQKKTGEARKEFEKSLDLQPAYLPPFEALLNLDLAAKQYNTALKRIQGKLDQWPKSAALRVLLAQTYAAKQETAPAEEALHKAIELDTNCEPAYLMLAKLYVGAKQNDKALKQINQTLAVNPRDISALMLKGQILDAQKNYAAARDAYEDLLAVAPNFSPALNNLAYLYCEHLGQLDKAYAVAKQAHDLTDDPFSSDTFGWVLYRRHQYTQALGLLQESAGKLPNEPEVQFHLGMAYYMTGDEERARKSLMAALASSKDFAERSQIGPRLAMLNLNTRTNSPEALVELQKRLAEQPDDPVALLKLAEIYDHEGAAEKAAHAYEQALKQNPQNAVVMIRLARLDLDSFHDSSKALALAKDAYKLDPDDAEVSGTLGRLIFASGDYKWALSLLQQSTQKNPQDPERLRELAMAYYSVGQVAAAESTMRSALKLDAPLTHASEAKQFLDLATLASHPGEAAQAVPRARQILQTDPTNVPALMVLATAAAHDGNTKSACDAYEQVLKRYPEFLPALKRLAVLYSDNPQQDQRAYDLVMKARRALPDDPDVARALGKVLYHRGDFRRAVRVLNESSQNGAPDAKSLYYLGKAYYRLKEPTESKNAFERALKLNLPSQLADNARQLLGQMK